MLTPPKVPAIERQLLSLLSSRQSRLGIATAGLTTGPDGAAPPLPEPPPTVALAALPPIARSTGPLPAAPPATPPVPPRATVATSPEPLLLQPQLSINKTPSPNPVFPITTLSIMQRARARKHGATRY